MPYSKVATWNICIEEDADNLWWMHEPIGDPLEKAVRAVTFINATDINIWFTTTPSTKIENFDMVKLAPNSYETWDISTHRSLDDKPLLIPVGTQFYARRFWMDTPAADTWVGVNCLIVEDGTGA